jgi:FHS family glucose/mannose:H+ symporter-like MFS transporter
MSFSRIPPVHDSSTHDSSVPDSSRALTIAANIAFVPVGIVTVLLGPLLPILSARWSLNYEQAGSLFTVQFLSSTVFVALSGICTTRWGFRFPIKAGLLAMAAGVAVLPFSSRLLGVLCIALYGAGVGLASPAGNLLVAAANPSRRGAALNMLNFSWSAGAVACPFLVAFAARRNQVNLLLAVFAGLLFIVFLGIAAMSSKVVEPHAVRPESAEGQQRIDWTSVSVFVFAAIFFLYLGLENSVGGWIASYAKTLSARSLDLALMTPSFFYFALMIGRWFAALLLHRVREVTLARAGLFTACGGMVWLLLANSLLQVFIGAGLAGIGLASIYPIAISLMSQHFRQSASAVSSLVFTVANGGGASLPWLVGYTSNRLGSLRAGMAIPLLAGVSMLILFSKKRIAEHEPAAL